MLAAAPPIFSLDRDARAAFDIARSVEQGGETLLLYELSKNQHLQLILPSGHSPAVPLVAMVPIGLEGFDRVESIYRLLASLYGRAVPQDTRLTPQKRRRMRHMLQAFDGFRDGATQQEIARIIFRLPRMKRDDWQISSARHTVMALLRDAHAMVAGGYRTLLRHRRSQGSRTRRTESDQR
ncbi:DUF2285 domain-containing protein [Afipia birgiae]|uniref:DUF2285 domain-containing protein n=1 Tax=Afipia birgiae TaxID=151414 RepID=UPI001FCB4945|nr:DUF2285 domain-containing protein [Afipia birgiae]